MSNVISTVSMVTNIPTERLRCCYAGREVSGDTVLTYEDGMVLLFTQARVHTSTIYTIHHSCGTPWSQITVRDDTTVAELREYTAKDETFAPGDIFFTTMSNRGLPLLDNDLLPSHEHELVMHFTEEAKTRMAREEEERHQERKRIRETKPPTYSVFVRELTGKKEEYKVAGDWLVEDLWDVITERTDMPQTQIRLIFAGYQLEAGRDLKSYNIQIGSTMHLILNLRGGKPVITFHGNSDVPVKVVLSTNHAWDLDLHTLLPIPTQIERQQVIWMVDRVKDGVLELSNGKRAPYLFWEANLCDSNWIKAPTPFTEVFDASDCRERLSNTLETMGMPMRDAMDFLTWWVPKIMESMHGRVKASWFINHPHYEKSFPLTITPTPVSIDRVFAIFTSTTEELAELGEVPHVRTEGFSVIEWGGMTVA